MPTPEQIRSLFDRAMDVPIADRKSFVRAEAGSDESLASQVLALLFHAEAETADFVPVRRDRRSSDPEVSEDFGGPGVLGRGGPLNVPEGTRIGAYTIQSLIGQGGMGAVYLAEQRSPHRRVALKLMRPGLASTQALRRFEHEAEVLGRLQHPGVAQIHEAGVHEGAPFFAMEFVDGPTLTQYADDHDLSARDRLRLFIRVCKAVHHAHTKGVVHRDLKPSNILVAEVGDPPEAQPKVLDFGVARATDSDVQATKMQTEIGQLIGTVPYMSPEQVSGRTTDVDTRSDVYALGVVLYELLAGRLPYDLKDRIVIEVARIIQEDDPTRLSSYDTRLRGDVETIVGKALEKERDRRYQSALDLGSDIRRYLSDEPIVARPASTWYQTQKFAKRNKALVTGVGAAFAALLIGLAGLTYGLIEANRQREFAEGETTRANVLLGERDTALAAEQERAAELQQVADFQTEQLSSIDAELMGKRLLASIIEAAPELERATLGEALADVNFTNIGLESMQTNVFDPALEAIDTQFVDQPQVRAQLLRSLARTLLELGMLDAARDPQQRALSIRRENLGDEHPDTLNTIGDMGSLLHAQGRLDEAEPYLREAMEGLRVVLGDEHPDTLALIGNMGGLLRFQGRLAEAEPYFREAMEGSRRVLGDEHPDTLVAITNLGSLLHAQGRLDEAEPYYREALEGLRRVLGDEHPDTLGIIGNMGSLLFAHYRLDEAEQYLSEALEGRRRVLGDEHPATLKAFSELGSLLATQGRLDEAEPYFREAMEGSRRLLGDEHQDTLWEIGNMGALLFSQGRLDEAEAYFHEALEGSRSLLGDENPTTQALSNNFVVLLEKQMRWSEAEEYRLQAVEILRRTDPEGGTRLGSALVRLGINLIEQGRPADAERVLTECLEIRRRVMPEGHWLIWNTQSKLGETIADQSRFAEAETLLIEAAEQIEPPAETGAIGVQRTNEAIQRVIDLYLEWHAAEPDMGYDAKAAEWRARLDAIQNTSEIEDGGG